MIHYQQRQKTINITENDIDLLRNQILTYFQQTWKMYEDLFTCLKREQSFYVTANPLRHPLIFYYGHTATFYINKLIFMKYIPKRIHQKFESMFAIGVDEMSWDDLNEAHYDWPKLSEVQAYRDTVYDLVSEFIQSMPLTSPISQNDPAWIVLMGIEHENIHIETSAILIRELPLTEVKPQSGWQYAKETRQAPENELLTVAGGEVDLAKKTNTYGWDNEYGESKISVQPFKASKYLVSNQEYKQFIDGNGYQQEKYWTEEGWQWCQTTKTTLPHFWVNDNNEFYLRTLTELIPMPWDWPVEVNYHEAKAFCNYLSHTLSKRIRLPSEAEWQQFASECTKVYPDLAMEDANIDLAQSASPCSVTKHQQGRFYDVIGNVWQWTETPIYGFSGFQVHPAYDDFSVPTFDEQHHIFKGGSCYSRGNEALLESRYAFRRHFFQAAGIRYIESEQEPTIEKDYYDSDALVGQYLELHYGSDYFNVKNFQQHLVQAIMELLPDNTERKKALDLGCAVGRGCFELTPHFEEVVGVDFSARFIQLADKLMKTGRLDYQVTTEGDLTESRSVELMTLSSAHHNIHFLQGDACNLHRHLTSYDLIIACNLIDRLYDPGKFLQDIKKRLTKNAVLAIASPYTWLEEHTKKQNWLGGYTNSKGEVVSTFEGLQAHLQDNFTLIGAPKAIPFVIRETARKYQHSLSELTLWQIKT